MKILFIILILSEISLLVAISTSPFVDRQKHAAAVAAYFRDPSSASFQEVRAQQEITQRSKIRVAMILGALLVANGCALFFCWRKLSGRSPETKLNHSMP